MASPVQSPSPEGSLKALAWGSGLNIAGRGMGQAAQMIAQIVVARAYGPAAFGLFGLGWSVFRILSFLAPMGVEHGVVRFGSARLRTDPGGVWYLAKACGRLSLVSSGAVAVTLFLVAPWFAESLGEPELSGLLRAFSVGLPLSSLLRVGVAATRVSQRMEYSVASEYLLQPLSFLALVVAVSLAGGTLVGLAWAATASFGLGALLGWYFARDLFAPDGPPGPVEEPEIGRLVAFSVPVAVAAAAGMAMPWLDRLVLAYFVSATDLGVYHAASQLALGLTLVTAATGAMLGPMVADFHTRGDLRALNRVFGLSVRWGVYLALAPALVLAMLPGVTLQALFGQAFVEGQGALVILTLGHLVSVGMGAPGLILVMVGRPRAWLMLSILGVGGNLLLNLILIPRFGLLGAAIATSLAVVSLSALALGLLKRLEGIWPYSRGDLWVALPASLMAGTLWLGSRAMSPSWTPWPALLLAGGIALLVLGLSLAFAGPPSDDRALLSRTLRRGHSRGEDG